MLVCGSFIIILKNKKIITCQTDIAPCDIDNVM